MLPPYLKRTRSVDELLAWLYLKGIATGDYQEAIFTLLGEHAQGLLSDIISCLKLQWQEEHRQWSLRDLSDQRYVYIWANGIYSKIPMQEDKRCLLVIIGVTAQAK